MIERVKSVISKVFNVTYISDNLKINDIEEWDSLGQINLVLGLEEEFGIKIPTEKILNLSSVDKIVAYIEHETENKK
jgi:acyl carrier protein